jgi:L-asparaginase II
MAAAHAEAAGVDEDSMPTAVDGCGVVTFGLSLERTAGAFSRLQGLRGGERIAEAMRAHPELIGGAGQADTDLMRALTGWIAKGGAEGLMCAAGPDGLGVALKAEDGSHRPTRPALHAFLGVLGLELPDEFARVPVRNAHGEDVGEVVCVL